MAMFVLRPKCAFFGPSLYLHRVLFIRVQFKAVFFLSPTVITARLFLVHFSASVFRPFVVSKWLRAGFGFSSLQFSLAGF